MFKISALETERVLEHDGMPVIKLTTSIPVISGDKGKTAHRINAFYGHIADAVEKHLKRDMLKHASAAFDETIANSRPFEPYRVKMTFEASQTEESGGLEVRRRLYIRTGKGAEKERILTERWNTRLGLPEKLKTEDVNYSLLIE